MTQFSIKILGKWNEIPRRPRGLLGMTLERQFEN